MARKRSSGSFNVNGFEGVDLGIELGEAIASWRDRYCSTVGLAKYRRAAGWAVDETAKQAVQNICWRFHSTLKRRSSWTQSAVAYKRLSKADLSALERGERNEADVFAQVYVKPKQSAYLKYLFGIGENIRLPGDVGMAQRKILVPWWDNITKTQGIRPTKDGGVPRAFLSRLAREAKGTRSPKRSGTQSRWGVYYGKVAIHGVQHEGYIARPPRVPVTDRDVLDGRKGASALDQVIVTRGGDVRRVGRALRNTDRPRILFLAVDRARYRPILQQPWNEACSDAAVRIPEIMAAQLADNMAHLARKRAAGG